MNSDMEQYYAELMRKASARIAALETELAAGRAAQSEPVAVVGMGCRFPAAEHPEAFWRLLREGVDAIGEVPAERFDIQAYYDPDPDEPGKICTRHGGFLGRVDEFDAAFFGVAPREAAGLDPQHRLLLEVTWEALEHAGLPPAALPKNAGVFLGISTNDYFQHLLKRGEASIDAYLDSGNAFATASGRLSYLLGIHGPCFSIETACSSSLVAVHQACQSLRRGECDAALAGGVGLLLSPAYFINFSRAHMLAPDGRCKTFDAAADGFSRGEGCGMVVLKRLADAQAQGDRILALIRGTAINQDGRTSGLTVPNGPAQQAVIRLALADAGLEPADVGYIEAHGTGTSLGDPIEMGALGEVFGERDGAPLYVGSVKTNFGHLEAAAGIAGLIKLVLALGHGEIPPHLHLREPSPRIDWDRLPVRIPTELTAWPEGRRVAGLSSFGFSGTNAHAVVEAWREPEAAISDPPDCRPRHLFVLSAKTGAALQALARRHADALDGSTANLADLCHTARCGRSHFAERWSGGAVSRAELRDQLLAWLDGRSRPGTASGTAPEQPPRIAFLFTGQGAQYAGMGLELYATQPLFRRALDRCNALLEPLLGVSLPDLLRDGGGRLDHTACTQPVLFALEYALAELWLSFGVRPQAVLGHSVGEYVAACIAGVYSLEDGLKLIAARGRLMGALPGDGGMLAVAAEAGAIESCLARVPGEVVIAAHNAPASLVLSGETGALARVAGELQARGIRVQPLAVSHAFHSPLMQPMLDEFAQVARSVAYAPPRLPVISNLTGQVAGAEIATPDYWLRHVLAPVRFAGSVATLATLGVDAWLEIGPKPVLLGLVQQCLETAAPSCLPSLRPGRSDWETLLESLGWLYVLGADIDWAGFDRDYPRRRVDLPTYPFQRQRYWADLPAETPPPSGGRLGGGRVSQGQESPSPQPPTARRGSEYSPLVHAMTRSPLLRDIVFESRFSLADLPFLADHRVFGAAVVPGASHLSLVLGAAELAFGGAVHRLEEVVFPAPLALGEEEVRTVQLVLTPEDRSRGEFRPHAFQLISFAAGLPGETPLVHASGVVIPGFAGVEPPKPSPAEIEARCGRTVDGAVLFELLERQGISLGPAFSWRNTSRIGHDEALGRFEIPAGEPVRGYSIHPRMLDTCFQQAAATHLDDGATEIFFQQAATHLDDGATETLLPFAVESLQVHAPSQARAWCCHARQTGQRRWDIDLMEADGRPIASIRGFEERAATAPGPAARPWQNWLYEIGWRPLPPFPAGRPGTAPGNWLLLADRGGTATGLAVALRELGARVALAQAAESHARTGEQTYTLRAGVVEDFRRLLGELPPLRGVVYLWGLDAEAPDTAQDLAAGSERLLGAALHLVQALAELGGAPPRLWLVTRDAQAVAPADEVTGLAQAPLWGLGRVIALEHPELRTVQMDLDAATAIPALAGELLNGDPREDQIAFRQGRRLAARLVRCPPGSPNAGPSIRPDRSYLVTGGLGGLGLQVARWLAGQGARHLLLLGRNAPGPEAARTLAELERQGVRAVAARADVADAEQLARVLRNLDPERPLAGIVHAAGVLDDGILRQLDWPRFARVLAPKVLGTWHLHRLTERMPLDFFVLFSSSTAVLGAGGQANYAAANAFLDAFAAFRKARGLPCLAVDWGAFGEVGMAATRLDRIDLAGEGVIAPAEGMEILAELLRRPGARVAVMPVRDWPRFAGRFGTGAPPLLSEWLAAAAPSAAVQAADPAVRLAALGGAEREAGLAEYLADCLRQVLGMDPATPIPADESWLALGMDSLMGLNLIHRIKRELGVKLPVRQVLENGSIAQVAARIVREWPAQAAPNAAKTEEFVL